MPENGERAQAAEKTPGLLKRIYVNTEAYANGDPSIVVDTWDAGTDWLGPCSFKSIYRSVDVEGLCQFLTHNHEVVSAGVIAETFNKVLGS